jgi:hypothetical protein
VRTLKDRIDVTEAAGLGEPAAIAVTLRLPDPEALPDRPVVCFAKPGAGYSRRYFTDAMPGPGTDAGAQADWHAARGWIFVAQDYLGAGESTHGDDLRCDFTTVTAASEAAEQELLGRLRAGTLTDGFPAIADPVVLGIGHSMGGCLAIVQQGRHHSYDGLAVLGFSAIHSHPPVVPGTAPLVVPWLPRDVRPDAAHVTNQPYLDHVAATGGGAAPSLAWGFHYDDVDPALVAEDLEGFPKREGRALPWWASNTLPATVVAWTGVPGAVAPEAAAVLAPVLVAVGERDIIADVKGEPRAYLSARSVDLFTCPRMAHMHNFAGTRELLWRRLERFGDWVADVKAAYADVAALGL